MKNLFFGLIATISFTSLTYGQATFDPEARKKKAEERQAANNEIKAKLQANKDRLLANLPKPTYTKEINNEYQNNYIMYDIENNPSNNREVLINKKALQNIDEKLKNFVNDYSSYHKNTFKSEIDKEQVELVKRYYIGATILKNINDTIPVDYAKFSDIPESDRFVYVAYKNIKPDYFLNVYESRYDRFANLYTDENPEIIKTNTGRIPHYYNDEKYYAYRGGEKIILQNTNTKLYYVINTNTTFDNVYYDNNSKGEGLFIKVPPTPEEIAKEKEKFNLMVSKYKTLIKTAKAKTVVLGTIQRKCLTRGYFDPKKVNALDKKTYNKTLAELKNVAKQLSDIDKQDTDNKAQDKLTIEELAVLSDVNNWNLNFYPIN